MLKSVSIAKFCRRWKAHDISFAVDNRVADRESVLTEWRAKKSGKKILVQRADEKDLELVARKRCEGFVGTNSIFVKMGATMDEMLPMFVDKTANIIGQRLSLLAFDQDNRLVGMVGSGSVDEDDIERQFGPPGEGVLEFKDDYYQDIIDGPYGSLNAKRYHVLCEAATTQSNKFMPPDVRKLGRATALYVHPEYRGEGIGTMLFAEAKRLFKSSGCGHWITYAVVDTSRNVVMHPDVGMKLLFTFPYSKFKERGVALFEQLDDGTTEHTILFDKL